MAEIIIEKTCNQSWNDSFSFYLYENEVCMEYGRSNFTNLEASKKQLLNNISNLTDITNEILVIIENIINLKKIVILNQSKKAIITLEKQTITMSISKTFIDIVQKS